MRTPIIFVLFFFWLFMAYRAFQRGDMAFALVLLAVGVALTAWRMGVGRRTT